MADYLLLSYDVTKDLKQRIMAKGVMKDKVDNARHITQAVDSLDLPEYITAEDAACLEEFMEF